MINEEQNKGSEEFLSIPGYSSDEWDGGGDMSSVMTWAKALGLRWYYRTVALKSDHAYTVDDVGQQILEWWLEWERDYDGDIDCPTPLDSFRYCVTNNWLSWRINNWVSSKGFGKVSGYTNGDDVDQMNLPGVDSLDALLFQGMQWSEEDSLYFAAYDTHLGDGMNFAKDPAEIIIDSDMMEQLERVALEALSDRQYLVYTALRQDRTQGEIADKLGVNQSSIQRMRKTIIKRLQENIV